LVAAGLEQALDYLEGLRFTDEELDWLESTDQFTPDCLDRLAKFRFTGDVYAVPEGTVMFAEEPLLRVMAPLPEAQLVESRLVNLLHFQTSVASKAARCRLAAGGKRLIDFGMRRSHGAEAAVLSSRASHIAGFDATANVAAGRYFNIPLAGTVGHSFIQAHDSELEAFRAFARCTPRNATLLLDTYDTERAASRAAQVAGELAKQGVTVKAVRIDSGDMGEEAKRVRAILDSADGEQIQILVSGSLDEHAIADLVRQAAPVDAFCVGTKVATCADSAVLDCVYKIQEYAGKPRRKQSVWKATWPGRRQVHRQYDAHGQIAMDMVCCADEVLEGKALLSQVMAQGRRTLQPPRLEQIRSHCASELATLPNALRSLDHGPRSPVKISARLRELAAEFDRQPR
jgi:nicotinate phosphoribosyltransferase